MDLTVGRPFTGQILGAAIACALALPANALTITPYFDSSITTAANSAGVEGAINTALGVIESLYVNPGTVNIVFNQLNTTQFLGESNTEDYTETYIDYVSKLTADSVAHPSNSVLATAVANLSHGNDANGAKGIAATSALLRVGLGFSGVTPCFDITGTFQPACGQTYDGVVTLTDSPTYPFFYSTPIPGSPYGFDAIATVEHEVNEILGGGGQGSVLNAIYDGFTAFNNFYGPLDLYRYTGLHTPSFSFSDSGVYFSVDGGATDIVGFNQNPGGDFADFDNNNDVQSAFSSNNVQPDYSPASPEFKMMESIGYDGVPEPRSLTLLLPALAGLRFVLRRRAGTAPRG